MRNLSFLRDPLTSAGTELDPSDPRYIEIADLAQRGEFSALTDKVDVLLDAGLYDIRLLCFYLYARFADAGSAAFGGMFSALQSLLGPNYEALGPTRKREQHVDKSVAWLCQKILDSVEYHQGKKPEIWVRWLSRTEPSDIALALGSIEKLQQRLQGRSFATAEPLLSRFARLLRDIHRTLTDQQAAPEAPSEARPPTLTPPAALLSSLPAPLTLGHSMKLQVSPQFLELDRKLRAFNQLVAHGAFEKAALVSDDLLELIEHFDPRKYFPEFFATFSRLMSEHVQDLEAHWHKRETIQWKTLKQFYEVDLDAFTGGSRE